MIFVRVRGLGLACRGHHELVLENLALRQQLDALKRTGSRPQLREIACLDRIGPDVSELAGGARRGFMRAARVPTPPFAPS